MRTHRKTFFNAAQPALIIACAGVLMILPRMAHAHQSLSWPACQCETEQYSLNLEPLGNGAFTKSPDKPLYAKGELVIVNYTPETWQHFVDWGCTPRSHFASGHTQPATAVYIMGDTALYARAADKVGLAVRWNTAHGTVDYPAGMDFYDLGDYQMVFLSEIDVRQTFTFSATPDPGYYTCWSKSGYGPRVYGDTVVIETTADTLVRYPNLLCVSVEALFQPCASYPPSMDSFTMNTVGGYADVFCSCAHGTANVTEPFLQASTTGPGNFNYYIEPEAEKGIMYVERSWGYSFTDYARNQPPGTYTAHLTDLIRLNIEVEGQGVVTSPHFRHAWPAKPYTGVGDPIAIDPCIYTGKTPWTDANLVTMTPSPCDGWSFDHWEYKNTSGDWIPIDNPAPGNPMPISVYMNWWTGAGWHVPEGSTLFSVKAVFGPNPLWLLEPNGAPSTDNHYVFDNADPGVCEIAPVASPGVCGYLWTLEEIAGSAFTSVPSPPDSAEPLLQYTGLPSSNTEFGVRQLTLARSDGSDAIPSNVEIFFCEEATNHPELTVVEQEEMVRTSYSGPVPNWYYFWRQTSAAYGEHRLDYESRCRWLSAEGHWAVFVGADANDVYSVDLDFDANVQNPEEYDWYSEGIDSYAWICRHEASHYSDFPTWWPNGIVDVSARSPDGDGIPSEYEQPLGYNPNLADSNNDLMPDEEDHAIRTQAIWVPWSAAGEDWAEPGQQSAI